MRLSLMRTSWSGMIFPVSASNTIGVGEQDSVWRMMGEFGGELGGAGFFDFFLAASRVWTADSQPSGTMVPQSSTVAKNLSRNCFRRSEPEIGGGEIESGDGVERDVLILSGGFDIEFGHALDAGFAFGEQRDFASVLQWRRGRGERSRRGRR